MRAFLHAAAAAHAGIQAVVVRREVHQLVHEPLAETLHLSGAVGRRGHHGEVGIHAAVPAAIALHAVAGVVSRGCHSTGRSDRRRCRCRSPGRPRSGSPTRGGRKVSFMCSPSKPSRDSPEKGSASISLLHAILLGLDGRIRQSSVKSSVTLSVSFFALFGVGAARYSFIVHDPGRHVAAGGIGRVDAEHGAEAALRRRASRPASRSVPCSRRAA